MSVTETAAGTTDMEALYQQRLRRYVTAMRNGKPDMVPIRPFVAEFTGRYAGYDCQQLAHDYQMAFDAAVKCAADFDWDATMPNMVWVWTGLAQALDLEYYGIPGIDFSPKTPFQYKEPPQDNAFMGPDEYDALIEDPTGFLMNVWLPRVSKPVSAPGEPASMKGNVALVKGSMAMMKYFNDFGPQIGRLREETGTVSAVAGIFKAPMDIIADKLRGYLGLVDDLFNRRDKLMAACEALMPHLCKVAQLTGDPTGTLPVGYWMHRGGVPFVSPEVFENVYWATTKPIIEELWANGQQTLFYAEGNWDHHLQSFAELPEGSIIYHVDQGDIFKAHAAFGDKFCLSGGVPNVKLAFSPPEEIRQICKEIIEGVAQDGGYIMDASAIVQDDAKVENLQAMTDATREFGVYSSGVLEETPDPTPWDRPNATDSRMLPSQAPGARNAGVMLPWEEKRSELGDIPGDEQLCKRIWEDVDTLSYLFIYHVLLSF